MNRTVAVVALILSLVMAGLALHTYLPYQPRGPLAFSVIAAAVITFFWFVRNFRAGSVNATLDESPLRRAVAASIVVEYLVLVGIVAFWEGGPQTLAPLTQTMLNNFTTVVGIVIAFYFGSSAYIEARKRTDDKSGMPSEIDKVSSAQPPVAADAPQAARR